MLNWDMISNEILTPIENSLEENITHMLILSCWKYKKIVWNKILICGCSHEVDGQKSGYGGNKNVLT